MIENATDCVWNNPSTKTTEDTEDAEAEESAEGAEVKTLKGSLEQKDSATAVVIKPCTYPNCENCSEYSLTVHNEVICTVPIITTKQAYFMLQDRIKRLEKQIEDLEGVVYP